MWGFGKKRCEAEQTRKVEALLEAQKAFLELYEEVAKPASVADELAAVRASLDTSNREIPRRLPKNPGEPG